MYRSSLFSFYADSCKPSFSNGSCYFSFHLLSLPDFSDMPLASLSLLFFNDVYLIVLFAWPLLTELATGLLTVQGRGREKRGSFYRAYICDKPLVPFSFHFPFSLYLSSPSWLWSFELRYTCTKNKTCRMGKGNQEVHELNKSLMEP